MGKQILIVDDEPDIVSLLRSYFEINGYEVLVAHDGVSALEQVRLGPDLILLDVEMPYLNGLEVCKQIRREISCPILFLTAKVEEEDKIKGFKAGGDDYILKPFQLETLGARVEAHLRREDRVSQVDNTPKKMEQGLVIDYASWTISYDGQPIPLVKKEFEIVELLSLNSGQVMDKERIYDRLWGYEKMGDSNVVTEHIRRIRNKFQKAGVRNYIETVWGVGYKWIK